VTTCDAHTAPGATSGAHGHPEVVDALAVLDRSIKTAHNDLTAAILGAVTAGGDNGELTRETVREVAERAAQIRQRLDSLYDMARENLSNGHDARRDFHAQTLSAVELVAEGVAKVGRHAGDQFAALAESIALGHAARREADELVQMAADEHSAHLADLDAEVKRRFGEGARTLKAIEQAAAGLTAAAAETQATVTRVADVVQQIAAGVERIAGALAEHHTHGLGTPETLAANTMMISELQKVAGKALDVTAASATAISRQGQALDELARGRNADSAALVRVTDAVERHSRRVAEAVEAVGGKLDMHHVHTAGVPEALTAQAAALAELKTLIGTASGVTTSTHQIVSRAAGALDGLVLGRAQDAQLFGTFGKVLDRHTRQNADAEGAHKSQIEMLRRIGDRLAITSGQHSGPAAAAAAVAGVRHEPDCAEH